MPRNPSNSAAKKVAAKLEGQKFNKLLVIERAGTKNNRAMWLCLCDCGGTKLVCTKHLIAGNVKSCGCIAVFDISKNGTQTLNKIYCAEVVVWQNMKQRCYNPNYDQYADYGGRGISVSPEWLNSFKTFILDMGGRPTPKHTLERINNNGNYCKENCRWATRKEQCANKRNNVWFEHDGKKMLITDWVKELGCSTSGNIWYFIRQGKSFDFVVNHYKNRL